MRTEQGESLRTTAEKLMHVLLPERDAIVEEIAQAVREAGFETQFTRCTHRERLEWLMFETMAAIRSLDRDPEDGDIADIAFAKSRFESEPPSVLAPAVALGCELETMRVLARHASAHCPDEETRKTAMRALVALFDRPGSCCEKKLRERVESFGADIIEGRDPGLPVFAKPEGNRTSEREFGVDLFSERELEVFRLVSLGNDNATIAETLFLSESTVKSHVRSMLSKVGLKNRTQLAMLGTACGVVEGKEILETLSALQGDA